MAATRRSRRLAAARDGGEAAEAERQRALQQATEAAKRDPAWRDWAGGLPEEVLEAVAGAVVAQTEAAWAGHLGAWGRHSERIEKKLAERKRDGNGLFVFARVCKEWRKAQGKVGGPLRTRVRSDVLLPGRVALAKWALKEGCPRLGAGYTLAEHAAEHGHRELVQWLLQEQGFGLSRFVMRKAAWSGSLELVEWLGGAGCPWDAKACQFAAQGGHLRVLQWLRAEGCPWDTATCKYAASRGHLETLRWACENSCDWDAETCVHAAAERGHLEVLQWLRANGCPWYETCELAAQYGHLETLRWAHENGCPWDTRTCTMAALSGHFETLRWAREHGCDWDAEACNHAAEGGHLEILQWLRANGCPWNHWTCSEAAFNGHVEVLRWARANGCPWNAETRDQAAAELGYTDDFGNLASESDDDFW